MMFPSFLVVLGNKTIVIKLNPEVDPTKGPCPRSHRLTRVNQKKIKNIYI